MYEDAVAMEKNDQEIHTSKKSYKDSMTGNSNGDEQNNDTMIVILTDEEIENLSKDDNEKCLLVENGR